MKRLLVASVVAVLSTVAFAQKAKPPAPLIVADANGKLVGRYDNSTVLISLDNLLVRVFFGSQDLADFAGSSRFQRGDLLFTSPDCTGQPYTNIFGGANVRAGFLFKTPNQTLLYVTSNSAFEIQLGSTLMYTGDVDGVPQYSCSASFPSGLIVTPVTAIDITGRWVEPLRIE
jgi:opacity protein-like surface antigen